jgi:hypothetical protein
MDRLDAADDITPEDVERAKAAAQRDGTPFMNAMLNAEVVKQESVIPVEEGTRRRSSVHCRR